MSGAVVGSNVFAALCINLCGYGLTYGELT